MEDNYISFGPLYENGSRALEYGIAPTTRLPGIKTANLAQLFVVFLYAAACYGIFLIIVDPILTKTVGGDDQKD